MIPAQPARFPGSEGVTPPRPSLLPLEGSKGTIEQTQTLVKYYFAISFITMGNGYMFPSRLSKRVHIRVTPELHRTLVWLTSQSQSRRYLRGRSVGFAVRRYLIDGLIADIQRKEHLTDDQANVIRERIS